ncbi:DNA repair protein RAD51 homolog 4 [Wyeomyia smithii]|uniref:DNA repair protein RAD51 homolog 4 n=1 Tax=Wyeomyia smithii TaxID=174621 RepID=UPI00246812B3|nr:DNA repair protein RAD51 homolog 4 [Wyeomyia smithii]
MSAVVLSKKHHPSLSLESIKSLNKNRIHTVLEFAQTDDDRLLQITNLDAEEISAIKATLVDYYSGYNVSVRDYFRYLTDVVQPINTGIRGLDLLLEGGLLPGHLLEICGESGAGKTQLCTSLAVNVAKRHKVEILYADCKCDFSANRVHQMLTAISCTEQEIHDIMCKIKVQRFFSAESLVEAMENFRALIDNHDTFKVLIIDSLPALWYLYQNSKSNCYPLGLLTRLIGILRKLATENFLCVVVVNLLIPSAELASKPNNLRRSTQNVVENSSYPALGKFWETVPTTRIVISKLEGNTIGPERLLTIWKCNYLKTGDRQIVTITDVGTS